MGLGRGCDTESVVGLGILLLLLLLLVGKPVQIFTEFLEEEKVVGLCPVFRILPVNVDTVEIPIAHESDGTLGESTLAFFAIGRLELTLVGVFPAANREKDL